MFKASTPTPTAEWLPCSPWLCLTLASGVRWLLCSLQNAQCFSFPLQLHGIKVKKKKAYPLFMHVSSASRTSCCKTGKSNRHGGLASLLPTTVLPATFQYCATGPSSQPPHVYYVIKQDTELVSVLFSFLTTVSRVAE